MSSPAIVTDQSADSQSPQGMSVAQQMLHDGSLPDMPVSGVPMRAVVAAASTLNPDAEARTQQLAQQAGMGVDVTRANPQAAQQRAVSSDLDRRELEVTNPILAQQLSDPNFAAVAHDDLDPLSRIEQHAAVMRAPTLGERIYWNYEYPVDRALMQFGPTRAATEAVSGAGEMAGNILSFFGLHGNGPTRQNFLQRQAQGGTPEAYGLRSNQGDAVVRNVAPMLPAIGMSMGAGFVARTLGLSENAAKVLGALGVGSAFTADQGGQTLTQMAAAGKSDAEARKAADLVAAINAGPNLAMGFADMVPGLKDYPLATALGIGGTTGAAGQLAQNAVTGQPLSKDLVKGAVEGAAVQGGMHMGLDFIGQMGDTIAAVKESKLRTRQPAAFQSLTQQVFDGDPSVRIPAQEFVDYFQNKNIDPAAMAHQVGVSNLAEAAAAGSDLEIPKANFFGQLDPEHQAGLLPDVVDPATELTSKQAEAGRAELDEWVKGGGVERLAEEMKQADAETQASPEWQKVYGDLKQRYVDAGEIEPVAENYATLQANAISYLAKNSGLKPDELLALHNPQVTVGEPTGQTLFQGAPEDEGDVLNQSADWRKKRNIEAARTQGELLKGREAQPAAETPNAAPAETNEGPEGTRGWFRVLPNGRYEIGKTKIGDLSTFIHEPAHAYLKLFGDLTQRGETSEALKEDFKRITEWLGTTPEEVYKNGFTREQHEQWARGNEQYVREGKAPSPGLQRAFQRFAVWLGSIYHRASGLGVELSDEVRGVMDRLYAGDDAVDNANRESGRAPLPGKSEGADMTDEEVRNYAEAHDLEVGAAKEQVRRELNEAAEREQSQDRREEARNVREAVTEQVDARAEYTAIRSLRKGKLDDGTELTLNKEALVKQFGEERVKALNQLHRGLYRNEGGTDAETAAEVFGYGSGEEMMRALENAPRRASAIEAATRDYLVNKYGDVRYDGTLNDRARFALENDERAANIYRQVRALRAKVAVMEKKAADTKAALAAITMEPLEHYREAARQMIEKKSPADIQPYRYLNTMRSASREAFDAAAKGNVRRAAEAKNKELLNHFLFREATEARDYLDKFQRYTQKFVSSRGIQQRMALAGGDYRDQANWLLARYKAGPMTARPERSLRDWAEEMYGAGNEPAIAPGILNEKASVDWRSVPMSEVRELHDALVNIRHLAQMQFKMFVQGKQVAFAEARAAMVNAARENLKVKPETIFDENRSVADRAMDVTRNADALLVRMERMVEWLDGGKTGAWHDNLWNLAADAQGDEYTLQHEVTSRVTDALADMPHEMRRRLWTEKVSVEGIPEPLTRRRLLSIAFNMGNEGNLDRLQKTFDYFGWDRAAVKRIGGMLTQEEWGFVQKAWDSLKPLGARMQELEKRLTGLPPVMVKVNPFKVALDDGTEMDLAGGYFPIAMDPRFSQRAIEQESKETAQNAMQSGYVRATTSRGYTKERTGFGGPLLLDYERVMTSHVAKVAKDLSHREFMLSSQRLLLDTEVRKTIRESLGPAYEKQFMPWLRTIINDRNGSVDQGLGFISDAMQTARSNIVAASIGFKASTLMLQITHAPRMMLYAKPASLAQALVDFLAHPVQETHEIHALSPNEMRYRGDSLDRDVRAVLQRPSYRSGYERKVAIAARFSLAAVDHILSHTLWRAAYRDGLEKYSDLSPAEAQKKAIYDADSAVRLGLNSQAPKDLPAIMRNNDFNKMITVLYGFHNGVYNQLRDSFHQARYDRSPLKLTYAVALTAILPAVLGDLVTGQKPKDGENSGLWAAQRALLFSADTIPMVSDVAQYLDRGRDLQFTPLESVMQQGAKALMEATSDKDEKDWMGIGLNAGGAAGELGGFPGSQQFIKTLRYWHRVDQGRVESPNWWNAIVGGGR